MKIPIRFEIGKVYEHSGGGMMHIVGGCKTTMYDWCLVAEEIGSSNLIPVGQNEISGMNWKESTMEKWMENFS